MSRFLPRPRPGRPFLRRGATRVQLGLDPASAVVVHELSEEAAAALLRLDGTAPRGDLERLLPELVGVLAALDRADLLEDEPGPATASEHRRARFAHDLRALALASTYDDALRTLARRSRATVVVRGNDRAASLIATGLATAGVGTVALEGPERTVDLADVLPSGPHEPDVPWREALSDVVRRLGAHPAPVSKRPTRPAVVVVCSAADVDLPWTDPELADDLLSDGVPHLAVAVSGLAARVGPFVLPGRSACLWCLDHRMRDADGAWPALADQVRLRHPTASASLGAVAQAAAALAVAQVLRRVDDPDAVPATVDAQVELRWPELLSDRLGVVRHPVCGCGWSATTYTMVG